MCVCVWCVCVCVCVCVCECMHNFTEAKIQNYLNNVMCMRI